MPQADQTHRAVVIGHGPTGRTVVRLLRDNGIDPTVVELNMDTVRALRPDGRCGVRRRDPTRGPLRPQLWPQQAA